MATNASAGANIQIRDQGRVFRNPHPELRAVHAWHPSLIDLRDGRWLCSFDLGAAPESLDYATYISRSDDDGATWSDPVRVFTDPHPRRATHTIRISRMRDGRLIGVGGRFFRDDPNAGLINTPGLGYTPMELILMTSSDDARSWSAPVTIAPPLVGPCFESCHALVELADGRLLWPTSTWMGWNGDAPNGMKAIALVSPDEGRTWPASIEIFDRWSEWVLHWEISVVQLSDGSVLAVAWALNSRDGHTDPTPFAMSFDGKAISSRGHTGFLAQTAKLVALPEERVMCAFRRHDVPGLWATVARIEGGRWLGSDPVPLWQGAASGMKGEGGSVGVDLSALAFGYPSLQLRGDGDVMLAFWCREDCTGGIRWMRLSVS